MTEYEITRKTALAYAIIFTVGPALGLAVFIGGLVFG